MANKFLKFFNYLLIWLVGGFIYYMIEILYRGYSHSSMFIVGGFCLVFIGLINELYSWDMYFELQVLIGDIIVLILEFCTGLIVNVRLDLNVWDYSNMKFNVMGQVCPQFALLWLPIIAAAIVLDDWIRFHYIDGEKPRYRFWIKEKFFKNITEG